MSGNVYELHRIIREGLEMRPSPDDAPFSELWEVFSDVTNLAGCRLMEKRMGGRFDAAEEVRLFLSRFARVAAIADGMPLTMPAPAVRGVRALGRLLEETRQVEDIGAFVRLVTPIVNDLSMYASRELGRYALPVVNALTFVGRAGSLMSEGVVRAVPELAELEEYR